MFVYSYNITPPDWFVKRGCASLSTGQLTSHLGLLGHAEALHDLICGLARDHVLATEELHGVLNQLGEFLELVACDVGH